METAKTTEQELITKMVGRDIGDTYSSLRRNTPQEEVVLEVKNLNTPKVHNVSFQIHKGETISAPVLLRMRFHAKTVFLFRDLLFRSDDIRQ